MSKKLSPLHLSADYTPADLLRQRLGLVIPADRLLASLRRIGFDSVQGAAASLRGATPESSLWQQLLRELAIGETYFFRQSQPLEAAIRSVCDAAAQHGGPHTFTAWSAGCATGEEAYTLAMLIRAAVPNGCAVQVIGTDINAEALATAQRAIYSAWSFRTADALTRGGLIADGADRWRVPDATRALVSFRLLNLVDAGADYPRADLVVCRNVLLYLSPSARQLLRERLRAAVNPGGQLLIDETLPLTETRPTSRPLPALTPPPLETSSGLYDQARVLADDGQSDAALAVLAGASPLNLGCAWLRAQIYMHAGGVPPLEMLRAVQRCLYIDPSFVLGYVTLGNLYAAQGDQHSARRQWANAVRLTAQRETGEALPFGEGLTAGDLHAVIGGQQRGSFQVDSPLRGVSVEGRPG